MDKGHENLTVHFSRVFQGQHLFIYYFFSNFLFLKCESAQLNFLCSVSFFLLTVCTMFNDILLHSSPTDSIFTRVTCEKFVTFDLYGNGMVLYVLDAACSIPL